MSLRLFDRITLLLKADAHGVVESLEERPLLLEQCLREAELDLNRKRARLDALREEGKRLREALCRQQSEIASLDEDVALALAGGKDDLARFTIRRLLPRRNTVKALCERIAECEQEAGPLAERLTAQQTQFESLRARVRAELAHGSDPAAPAWSRDAGVADEEIEIELLRRRGAEGGVR